MIDIEEKTQPEEEVMQPEAETKKEQSTNNNAALGQGPGSKLKGYI